MFTVGVQSAGTARQQSGPKRGEKWRICLKRRKRGEKSFGLLWFEFLVFHSRRPLNSLTFILKCVGDEKQIPASCCNNWMAAKNKLATSSREDCFKSQPRLTRQSQSRPPSSVIPCLATVSWTNESCASWTGVIRQISDGASDTGPNNRSRRNWRD